VVLTQDGKPDIIVQPGELVWRGPTKPVYSISFRNPAGSRSATASSSSASSTSTPPIVVSGDGARPTGTLRRSGDARHLTANIDLDGQTCVVSLSSLELKAYEVFDIWLKQLSRQSKGMHQFLLRMESFELNDRRVTTAYYCYRRAMQIPLRICAHNTRNQPCSY